MSFKSFSTAQNTPAKDKPADQLKDAPANDQPSVKPETASSENTPTSKS